MKNSFFLWFCLYIICAVDCRKFYPYSYDEIADKLLSYESNYPNIFELQRGSDKYNIKFPTDKGHSVECSQKHPQCEFYITITTNFESWKSNLDRPQLFFSGALHGNERVGPTTLVETIDYLLVNYETDPWINHLINNRVIIMTPMTNAHGYAKNRREENGDIDPNRDFPIDLTNSDACMQSLTVEYFFINSPKY